MQVGEIVKCLDFNESDDCYITGKVVDVYLKEKTFRAEVVSRTWRGQVDHRFKFDYFTAPISSVVEEKKTPRIISYNAV